LTNIQIHDVTFLSESRADELVSILKDNNQVNLEIFQKVPGTFRYFKSPTTNFTDEEKEKLCQSNCTSSKTKH